MFPFVPELPVIAAFALATLVLAITPGPDMAYFISRSVNFGRPHGIAAVAGASTGLFVHTLLAAFGVSLLLATAPTAFLFLKIIGALYLLWLAIDTLRKGGGITLQTKPGKKPTLKQSFFTGVGINLSNPKIILFFVTFLPQFISQTDPRATEKLLFLGLEFLVISIPVVAAIVFLAQWIGDVLTRSKTAQRLLNWSFAAVFATFAIAILTLEGKSRL